MHVRILTALARICDVGRWPHAGDEHGQGALGRQQQCTMLPSISSPVVSWVGAAVVRSIKAGPLYSFPCKSPAWLCLSGLCPARLQPELACHQWDTPARAYTWCRTWQTHGAGQDGSQVQLMLQADSALGSRQLSGASLLPSSSDFRWRHHLHSPERARRACFCQGLFDVA